MYGHLFRLLCLCGFMVLPAPVVASCDHLAVDTSKGIVTDYRSNRVWSRCLVGQASSSCFGSAKRMSWVDALNHARAATAGGIDNWRLPKIAELQDMARSNCVAAVFPGLSGSVLWSASANLDYATDAWAYDFTQQLSVVRPRDSAQHLWLVANSR